MAERIQWTENFIVQGADADFKDRMRPSALLRYAERAVTHQMQQYGMDDAFFSSIHAVCLLGKQALAFDRVPQRGEALTCVCLPERSHGGTSKRFCAVYDAQGKPVARVDSRWILVNTLDRRIVRHPSDDTEAMWNEVVPEELPQLMPRAAQLADGGRCSARYSLCDKNGHINNACYLDIACDLVPVEELRQRPIRRAALRYHREMPLGSEMQLRYGRTEQGWYVRGEREGHAAFEAFCGF
jgi:acyl-ACP thioesterase